MKKIYASLVAFCVAVVLTLSLGAPAQASWTKNNATSTDEGVSLYVSWERDTDNVGFKLDVVEISGCGGTCVGVQGDTLKCVNQDGRVNWSKTGSDMNLGHSDLHLWTPNQLWSNATELKCVYNGEKIDAFDYNGPDPFSDIVHRT